MARKAPRKTSGKAPEAKTPETGEEETKGKAKAKAPEVKFGAKYLAEKMGKKPPEVRRRLRKVIPGGAQGSRYNWDTQEEADKILEQLTAAEAAEEEEEDSEDDEDE